MRRGLTRSALPAMPDALPPDLPHPPPAGLAPSPAALGSALLGIALFWLAVLGLNLTPALFALLITYGGTHALAAVLRRRRPTLPHAERWALLGSLLLLGAGIALLVEGADAARAALPDLLQHMAAILEQVRTTLPTALASHLPASLDGLRDAAVHWLRAHAAQVQLWGEHTLRGLGYVLAGVVIGALMVMQLPAAPQTAAGEQPRSLPAALHQGFAELVQSFTRVVFAQMRIATINLALTAVFLLGILPLVSKPVPMTGTLLAVTFFAGLLPVVGNLLSNTMIVILALSSSLLDAGLALLWLVAIHKLEYFLNAHIIGSRIRAQAWELLLVMLVMEALAGLAGLVSGPVIYAQIKLRLHARGWLD